MLHAVLVVLLLGFGDSLNPTTIGPGMYLATLEHASRRIAEFLVGFVAVNLCGGLLIMFGPGQLLLDLVPKPDPTVKHVIELIGGVVLVGIGIALWARRRALGRLKPPTFGGSGRTGVMLGAGIAVAELPTAMPYFAAIAVILASGVAAPGKVLMLIGYNVAFLSPVLAILMTLVVLGDDAKQPLARVNLWVLAHWPGVLATLAASLGVGVLALGVIGFLA